MRKEARLLLNKAVNSLILSIEYFNRPWNQGRIEAVLILINHSFEMLLKAAIIHRGGKIRKPREKQTIGFDACVHKALRDDRGGFINEEQALTLQIINSLRDAAQHHLLDISENHLYINVQSGLTLFRDIMKNVFGRDITKEMPERVLPVSTSPPLDIAALFDEEINEIKKLLKPHSRRRIEALAKLRAHAIMEGAIQGEKVQPADTYLRKLMARIQAGEKWNQLFPGVAAINLISDGRGPTLNLRFTKKEGIPIQVVPEGTPGAAVVAIKRVDELGFYNLRRNQLAEKIGLSGPKTSAAIWYLEMKSDSDCYKQVAIGKSKFDLYSQQAIAKINEGIQKTPIEEIWKKYHSREKNESHKR